MSTTLYRRRTPLSCLALAAGILLAACGSESPQKLVESGKAFQAKQDHKAAVIQFKSALQGDPSLAEARLLLGQSLMLSGEPGNAVIELFKARDGGVSQERVMPLAARAMLASGDVQRVVTDFAKVELADKAAAASLATSVATAWAQLKETDKARSALDKALALQPDHPPALVLHARLLAGASDYDRAITAIDAAIAKAGNSPEAWVAKGEILSFAKRDAEGADAAFRKALEIEPANLAAHTGRFVLRRQSNDLPGMQAQVEALRAAHPKHPQTAFLDAQVALFEDKMPRARELSQLLMQLAPNNVSILQLSGTVEARMGALPLAESRFTKALQREPELTGARHNLARIYLRLGQPRRAMQVLEPLLRAPNPGVDELSLAGEAELMDGNVAAAEAYLRRASEGAPADLRVQTSLAMAQLAGGAADVAFEQLAAVSSKSKDTLADMAIVSSRLQRREFDAALRAVDAMAAKQPNSAEVEALRGRVLLARADYPGARAAFEKALAIDAAFFTATVNLAAIDVLERKPKDAEARFEAAIQKDPRNVYARLALYDLQARAGKPFDALREALNETIKAAPSDPDPRLRLIELLSRERLPKDALAAAQEAAAALPNDLNVLDALGVAQMRGGEEQQAITTFRRIASLDARSARPHTRLADIYRANNNLPAAISSFEKALEIAPDLQAAQTGLIRLLVSAKRPKDALQVAQRMQQRRPGSPTGWLFEGAIHNAFKAPDAALKAYRSGLEKLPAQSELAVALHKQLLQTGRAAEADDFARKWVAQRPDDTAFEYQLAVTAIVRGDLPGAQARLERVVSQVPGHALALNNLAAIMVRQGKPGAVPFAQRALDLLPDQPAIIDTAAMALAADKQYAEALALQRRALGLFPNDPGLRLHLARILAQSGDKAAARQELERLRAAGASAAVRAEADKLMKTL